MAQLDLQAGSYDTLYRSAGGFLWDTPGRLIRRVQEWLPSGATVFDAGCGDGKNALHLHERGYAVNGCDISSSAIALLSQRFGAAGYRSREFDVADVAAIHLPAGSLDCVVSYGLFHAMSRDVRAESHRRLLAALKPGGVLLFSALRDTRALDADHLTPGVELMSADEVRDLVRGLDVLHASEGTIRESHPPLVPQHAHDVIWIAARRPQ
jgi:SAM-dependent methyltransferase